MTFLTTINAAYARYRSTISALAGDPHGILYRKVVMDLTWQITKILYFNTEPNFQDKLSGKLGDHFSDGIHSEESECGTFKAIHHGQTFINSLAHEGTEQTILLSQYAYRRKSSFDKSYIKVHASNWSRSRDWITSFRRCRLDVFLCRWE